MPSLLQQRGDLKESTPTAIRVVEYGKQEGKGDIAAYKHPSSFPNFIAYRAPCTPDAAPWLPFMCWGQVLPRSLQMAGQKLSWLVGVGGRTSPEEKFLCPSLQMIHS